MNTLSLSNSPERLREYLQLAKPRVVALIVFTAMIGMVLARPGLPESMDFLVASLGIALAASGAAVFNCLVERHLDAVMARTRARATARGVVGTSEGLALAGVLGGAGFWMLYEFVNPLTAWLTMATFVGYAVIYTLLLKPATPQNIVIGGASGAMPPVLGWAAMTGTVSAEALILFLIIFVWTPPHFWSLALYRREEYARAGLPMLPITHGERFTRLSILLYTCILAAVSLMPVAVGMSGRIYFLAACLLDAYYLLLAWRLLRSYSDALARYAFAWSILYLGLLFTGLLLDHFLSISL